MDEQILEYIYYMVYGGVMVLSLVASCYMLFRRANAIAPDITSPVRLRRWAATFFAALALCHLWYMPMYFLSSSDDVMLGYLIAGLLDSLTIIPLTMGITYSTYINGLRIQHFINLYHEAVATHQPITVRQLAHKSGFHSYNTFRNAFKRKTGQSVTAWMKAASEREQSQARLDSAERKQAGLEGKVGEP